MINNNVVITSYKNKILCIYQKDMNIEDVCVYPNELNHLNSVFIGKVKNIVKNINAAFVEINPGLTCFLSLDESKYFKILNRKCDNNELKQGDELVVQLIKGAVKSKLPVCSARLRLPKDDIKNILSKAPSRTVFSVLYSASPEYLQFFKRIDMQDVMKITVDSNEVYGEVAGYLDAFLSDKKDILQLYTDDYSLSKLYKIDSLIAQLTDRIVWLKSGGNIVIDYTEAMTVIDVNSAKAIYKKDADFIYNLNVEACNEAFRQIRMRNLSGMILIDFINDTDEYTDKLIEYVKKMCETDCVTLRFIDITGLKIVELTRNKVNAPIYEML